MLSTWHHCFEAGNESLNDGNLRNALRAYTDALEACRKDEQRPRLYYSRAYVYWAAGHPDRAIDDLNNAIKIDADFADAYNLRGLCNKETLQFQDAICDFSQAISLGMTDSAYLNRAAVYEQIGLIEFAVSDLSQVMERASEARAKMKAMIANLTVALEQEEHALLYADRALVFEFLGNSREAAWDIQRAYAVAYTPRQVAIVRARHAQMKLTHGDLAGAVVQCNEAVLQDPYCLPAFYFAALSYLSLGQYSEAELTFAHCQSIALPNDDASKCYKTSCEWQLAA